MGAVKDRIGVLFGGRSQEHEISVLSAASLMDAINRDKHDIVPVAIDKDGAWYLICSDMSGLCSLKDPRMETLIPKSGLRSLDDPRAGTLIPRGGLAEAVCAEARQSAFVAGEPGANPLREKTEAAFAEPINIAQFAELVDFVFPMLHGPLGEDGTVQGLFEILGIPYAGCGVCGSAVSMDKIYAKKLLEDADVPVLHYTYTTVADYRADAPGELARIERTIGYPVFVKPANMGSSVGVSRANGRLELSAAIEEALRYDRRVLIEEEACMRELEAAVLGNDVPSVGAVGEIVTGGAFYDYETKYKVKTFDLNIPAGIPEEVEKRVKDLALRTYKALDGAGFARVDFFAGNTADDVYVNEMNTIPGFTQYSMFPRLWEAAGLAYPDLIENIIALGYERHSS
jgi:D-alanine-D-alanine ligase